MKAAYENYFGKAFTVENVTPAEAAIIAALPKSPSNYDLVRNAIERVHDRSSQGRGVPGRKSELVVPDDTTIVQRRNDILDLLAQGDRTPISGDQFSQRGLRGGQGRRGHPEQPDDRPLDRPALRLGGPRPADRRSCAGPTPTPATPSRRAACASRPRSTSASRRSPRSGSRRRPSCPIARTRRRPPRRSASRATTTGCATSRTRTSATARSSPRTTRPASSSPTSAPRKYYATRAASGSSRSTTSSGTASASRARRSSRSTTPWPSTTAS